MPDTPTARAVIYEMPATATAPRSRTMELTPDEARVVELHREMLAQTRDADGGRVAQITVRHIGDRVQLRVERSY